MLDKLKKLPAVNTIFISTVEVKDEKHVVKTEVHMRKKFVVETTVSRDGKVLSKRKAEVKTKNEVDPLKGIFDFMVKQHHAEIGLLKKDRWRGVRSSEDYMDELNDLVRDRDNKKAIALLNDALIFYPNDPFLLSYHGCLDAIVNNKYKEGIEACKSSFISLKENVPFGEDYFLPLLYLNLGRAYLAAGRKRNAIGCFKKGLEMDSENQDIMWELDELGARKKPAVPLLERSNPINKYVGMLLHKISK
jgi:tetratricopeptide (TPR) repeat protein